MADNPFVAGLAAGYSPTELLTHAGSIDTGTATATAAARKSGYSDAEIVNHLAGASGAPTSAPGSSMADAAGQSIVHGTVGPLASAAAWATRGIEAATGRNDPSALANANTMDAYAADQRLKLAQNYQRPADVAKGPVDAVTGSSGVWDATKRLGRWAGFTAAENAAPLAANVAAGFATDGLSAPASAAALSLDAGLNADGARASKRAAGLDDKTPTLMDAANVAAQTAAFGAVGSKARGFLGRTAEGAAAGAVQPLANSTSDALQGGKVDWGQTANDALSGAVLGGGMRAGAEGVGSTLSASSAAVGNALQSRRAGPNMRAFQDETAPYNDARAQAAQVIQKANPGMAPDAVDAQAHAAAVQSGAEPVPYDKLSRAAQNGMAELATVQMYDQAKATMTSGMGRSDEGVKPGQVFKAVLQGVSDNLGDFYSAAKQAGIISKDQLGTALAGVSEARKHNVLSGEGGAEVGYFDTLRDQIKAFDMDPVMKNQGLAMLNVADIASQNALYKNSMGPLERNAGTIGTGLGLGIAGLTHGVAGLAEGGLISQLVKGQTRSVLRGIDGMMGTQVPDIVQRSGAIQDYAKKNGLSSVADPQALMQMTGELRGLSQQTAQGPALAQAQQAMAEANQGPLTSPNRPGDPTQPMPPPGTVSEAPTGPSAPPGQSPTGQAPQGPVAPSGGPQMAPQPQAAPAPAPMRPQMAQGMPNPAGAPQMAPTTPAQAMQATTAALQAKAQLLGQSTSSAFPSDRRGWSAAIADQTGVQHGPMMDLIQSKAAGTPLADVIQGHTIPGDVMRQITNHVADARDAGTLPLVSQAAPAGVGIRNPQAYQAAISQEAAAGNAARTSYPDGVAAIQQQSTKAGRGEALDSYLATMPPEQRIVAETILRPLTGFGASGPSASSTPSGTALSRLAAAQGITLRAGNYRRKP